MSLIVKSCLFVTAQFALLLGIVLLPGRPTPIILQLIGLGFMGSGLGIGMLATWQLRKYSLTALPSPTKDAKLLRSGLYTHVRHPIYTGLIVLMSGVVLSRFSWLRLLLLLCLIIVLQHKTTFEEAQLTKTFGKTYKEYVSKTRRFI